MPKWLQYYIGGEGSLRTTKSDYVICARPLNGKNSRSSIAHAGSLISHIFCKRMKPFFTNSLFNMIESETKVLKLISILDVIQVRSRNFRLVNTEVRCESLARLRTSQSLLFWSSVLKGAGSFHIHRKTMKELGTLALLGIRERPNLAQNLVTHWHW